MKFLIIQKVVVLVDKIDKNGTAIFFFIIVLLVIIVGGYLLVKNRVLDRVIEEDNTYEFVKSKIDKIDKQKDYIYFNNEDVVSEEEDIVFKDIVFNFDSKDALKLAKELNDDMDDYKDTLELDNEECVKVTAVDYEVIESNKYITLIVNKYNYTLEDEKDSDEISYYVIDLYSGNILSNSDIMKNEGIEEKERTARFVCTLVFVDINGKETCARGTIEGRIAYEPAGEGGFGYDPIFLPQAGGRTAPVLR